VIKSISSHSVASTDWTSFRTFNKTYDLLRVLASYPNLSTVGLVNNTVHDLPTVLGEDGIMVANATQVVSSCGTFPDAYQLEFVTDASKPPESDVWLFPSDKTINRTDYYRMQLHSSLPVVAISALPYGRWRIGSLGIKNITSDATAEYWNAIIVVSTFGLLDSTGVDAPLIPVDTSVDGQPQALPSDLRVVACRIDSSEAFINVATSTGSPPGAIPTSDGTTVWQPWEDDHSQDAAGFIGLLGNYVYRYTTSSTDIFTVTMNISSYDIAINDPTDLEAYLNSTIGGLDDTGNLPLPSLQKSIEKSVAAALWYVGKAQSTITDGGEGFIVNGNVVAELINERAQLNLNIVPLIVGLVTSCFLLILSTIMIYRPVPRILDDSLDTPGILQLTWLLSRSPNILKRFVDVETPDPKRLRETGMFEVNVSEIEDREA